MLPTIRAVLRKDKINKDGACPIAICVTISRKRTYHNTGIKVPEKYWNGKEVKSGFPNASTINAKLLADISDLQRQLLNTNISNGKITVNVVKSLMKKDLGRGDFIAYCENVLNTFPNEKTYKRYKVEYDKLKKYSPQLSFGDVTPVFLNKYKSHLLKGVEHNTMVNGFKFIRMVFNHARNMGETTLYPFEDWPFPKYKQPVKEFLTLDEVQRIWDLLSDDMDKTLQSVIAFFCLECYAGLRFSDWGNFKVEERIQGKSLFVRSTKTGVPVTLPLEMMPTLTKVLDYIKEHDLRINISGEHVNRILKIVALSAKIPKVITTHTGRRTCGTMWLEKGMSREGVCALLGVSMPIVNIYAKFTGNKLRSEIARIGGI